MYTWRYTTDSTDRIVRNQIDYIIVNRRCINAIISVKTCPGADISSDHSPVFMYIVKLKAVKSSVVKKTINPRRLEENSTYTETKIKLNGKLRQIKEELVERTGLSWRRNFKTTKRN